MRRICVVVAAALPVVAVALAWTLWVTRDPVRDNFERVQINWTLAEVIAVMGDPSVTNQNDARIVLNYQTTDGVGVIFITQANGVIYREWVPIEPDPIWLRIRQRVFGL